MRVKDVMTEGVLSVSPHSSVAEALQATILAHLTRADFVRALSLFLQTPGPQQPALDEEIKQRIEAELQAQPWAPAATTEVSVAQDVVRLTGVFTEEKERSAIHALIENVSGVCSVEDKMTWIEPYSVTPVN